jgi:hypothetical protein
MTAKGIEISVDVQAATDFVNEAQALFETLQPAAEVRNRFLSLLQSSDEFVFLEVNDRAAAGAGQLCMGLYPGDRLRRFLAALRAGNRDLAFIENTIGHGGPPL